MSESKFGSWTVAESPVTLEYSLVVIEEIRHEVAEGFQRLSRGGIEVGGVLYGTRDGRTVRVLALRPIACEHARGPAFLLSDKDRQALNAQLLRDAEDPQLEGLISVGWFLSHTRSEIALTESDLELYSIFFPAPWQATLVIRPGRGGSMRAGFFVREADGTVKSERSYLEFNFPDRLAGVLASPERAPRERPGRRIPTYYRADEGAVVAAQRDPAQREQAMFGPAAGGASPRDSELGLLAGPQLLAPTPPRRKWPWLVVWAAVIVILAAMGLRYWMQTSLPEPISLSVIEHDGQLQIHWNSSSRPVRSAVRGALEIADGGDSRTIELTRDALAGGNMTAVRKSGDVEIRLTVENAEGVRSQEASRYLGPPPTGSASSRELDELKRQNAELEAEVVRLHQEDSRKAERIQQLERLLKLRLGTTDQDNP